MVNIQTGNTIRDTAIARPTDSIDLSAASMPAAQPILVAQSLTQEGGLNPIDVGVGLFTLGAWGVSSAWGASKPARDALGRAAGATLNQIQDLAGRGVRELDKILVPPVAPGTIPPGAVPISTHSATTSTSPSRTGIAPLSPELRQQIAQHLQAVNECIKLSSEGEQLDMNSVREILRGTREISEYLAKNGHPQILTQQKANEIETFVGKRNAVIAQFHSDKARIADFRDNLPGVINTIDTWRNFSDEGKAALKDYLKQVNEFFNTAQIVSDRLEKTGGLGPYFNQQMRRETMRAIEAKLTVQEWNSAAEYYSEFRQMVSQGELPLTEQQLNSVLNYMEGLSKKLVDHGLAPEMTKANREEEARNYKGLLLQASWETKVKEYNDVVAEGNNGKFISDKDMNTILNDLELISKQLVALGSQPLLTSEQRKELAAAYTQARLAFSPETGPVFPGFTPGGVGDPNYASNNPENSQDTTADNFPGRTTAPTPRVDDIADPNYARKPESVVVKPPEHTGNQENVDLSMPRTEFPDRPGNPSITTPKEREAVRQQEEAQIQQQEADQPEETAAQEEKRPPVLEGIDPLDPTTWGNNSDVGYAMLNWYTTEGLVEKIQNAPAQLNLTVPTATAQFFTDQLNGQLGTVYSRPDPVRVPAGHSLIFTDLGGSGKVVNSETLGQMTSIALIPLTLGSQEDRLWQAGGDGSFDLVRNNTPAQPLEKDVRDLLGNLQTASIQGTQYEGTAYEREIGALLFQQTFIDEINAGGVPGYEKWEKSGVFVHQLVVRSEDFGNQLEVRGRRNLFNVPEFYIDVPGIYPYIELAAKRDKDQLQQAGYGLRIPLSNEEKQLIINFVLGAPDEKSVKRPSGLVIPVDRIPAVSLQEIDLPEALHTNVYIKFTHTADAAKHTEAFTQIAMRRGIVAAEPTEATGVKISLLNRMDYGDLTALKRDLEAYGAANGVPDLAVSVDSDQAKATLAHVNGQVIQAWLGGASDFFPLSAVGKSEAEQRMREAATRMIAGLSAEELQRVQERFKSGAPLSLETYPELRNALRRERVETLQSIETIGSSLAPNLRHLARVGFEYDLNLLLRKLGEQLQNQPQKPQGPTPGAQNSR